MIHTADIVQLVIIYDQTICIQKYKYSQNMENRKLSHSENLICTPQTGEFYSLTFNSNKILPILIW